MLSASLPLRKPAARAHGDTTYAKVYRAESCSTMRDLSPDDRPREKLSRHGVAALGDNELVALVIGQGSRQGGALSVANHLLAAYGGIHGLARCMPDELSRVPGIGGARAAQIAAAFEVGRRTLTRAPAARPQI